MCFHASKYISNQPQKKLQPHAKWTMGKSFENKLLIQTIYNGGMFSFCKASYNCIYIRMKIIRP